MISKYEIVNDIEIKEYSIKEIEERIGPYIKDESSSNNEKKNPPIDTTRSGKEWAEICRLVKKEKSKEQIFEEMNVFKKWAEGTEQYREHTYKKAIEKFDESEENKEKKINEAKGRLEGKIVEYFTDQDGTAYVTIKIQNHLENWKTQSKQFRNFITKIIYETDGKPPSDKIISSLQSIFSAKAEFEGKKHNVFLRVACVDDAVYVDIGDNEWNILKITSDTIQIISEQGVKFKRFRHMKPIVFDLNAAIDDINLILKHIPLQDEEDKILFIAYLPLLFLEKIPTIILILYGPQGSGKSMSLKFIRDLVDPSSLGILSLPNDINELVQQVSHHYLPYYDNVSYVTKAISDFFCRVVTGEGYSKRELYSDDEDIIYNYRRKIAINGINLPGQEADFLDRCLTLHLARINKKFRKTEEDLWASFEVDRPKITGAIIKIVQETLQKIKEIKIEYLPRMADYTKWGEAISQVLGEESGKFTNIYFNKIDKLNKEALEANPVGICIVELMGKDDDTWTGTSTELLNVLIPIAEELKVDRNTRWPKGPQVLTRKINEISSNLEDEGIKFESGHTGKKRFIRFTKVKETVNTVNTVNNEENKNISDKTAITDNNNTQNLQDNFQIQSKVSANELKQNKEQEDNSINTKNTEDKN